ncbi:MAG: KpsF/GutQ family sugar-phosphate isomerase [Pseudomonadota bacterium]
MPDPVTTIPEDDRLRQLASAVLDVEARSIAALNQRLDAGFLRACHLLLGCRGRVVVTGMGKSGHIGGKIAATLASTGTPAFFVHPGEASHGDLGMITGDDVVVALSNSGETDELLTILPILKRLGVPLVALTGRPGSTLAQEAEAHVDVRVDEEACPLGLAPTSSTTAALAMGDALAVALLEARGFGREDFARTHPSGRLGKRLLVHIRDIMHQGEGVPRVAPTASLADALVEMSRKGLGFTLVAEADDTLAGIFTDGDLRRVLDHGPVDVHTTAIGEVMTRGGRTLDPDQLAAEALEIMERHRINGAPVVDGDGRVVGACNMHDMLRSGVA